jgi:SAM-dependent methyltransferase
MKIESLPLASAYDPVWAYSHAMGPNPLWLAEIISRAIELKPGMRVLDLGCGTASSSILLAREFGVSVCAADLWRSPDDNLLSIEDAGCRDLVFPMRCEAHTLPFARGYFDVIISLDAYHYFGTDVKYLSYCSRFLRPGGSIAILCPGNSVDLGELPDDQRHNFDDFTEVSDFFTWHSAAWWRRLWSHCGTISVTSAEMVDGGWELWHRWAEASAAWDGKQGPEDTVDGGFLLPASGRTLGFGV